MGIPGGAGKEERWEHKVLCRLPAAKHGNGEGRIPTPSGGGLPGHDGRCQLVLVSGLGQRILAAGYSTGT